MRLIVSHSGHTRWSVSAMKDELGISDAVSRAAGIAAAAGPADAGPMLRFTAEVPAAA